MKKRQERSYEAYRMYFPRFWAGFVGLDMWSHAEMNRLSFYRVTVWPEKLWN